MKRCAGPEKNMVNKGRTRMLEREGREKKLVAGKNALVVGRLSRAQVKHLWTKCVPITIEDHGLGVEHADHYCISEGRRLR